MRTGRTGFALCIAPYLGRTCRISFRCSGTYTSFPATSLPNNEYVLARRGRFLALKVFELESQLRGRRTRLLERAAELYSPQLLNAVASMGLCHIDRPFTVYHL